MGRGGSGALARAADPAENGAVRVANPLSVDVEAYFRTWGPMVHRRCAALLKSEAEADDATQEVFVRVLRRAQQGAVVDDKPVSYLWKVATHVCLNRLRSRKRRPEDSTAPEDLVERIAAVDDGVGTSPVRRALDRIFAAEPASTRTMAVLHFVDGLTLEETAAEMGMSVSGVRKRLRVLKEKLQTSPEREELS
jgi:RNA polymerase sigma-70 factor (ECF subfamily)